MMVQNGREACFMKDKKGYLPAHVACSRHCSPEKLHMLLKINRGALTSKTNAGDTLLSLAIKSATRSHPNYALIDDLKRRLDDIGMRSHEVKLLRDEESRRVSKFENSDGRRNRSPRMAICSEPELVSIKCTMSSRPSCDENQEMLSTTENFSSPATYSPQNLKIKVPRKRKVTEDEEMDPATLLLHFSRHTNNKQIKLVASV